MINPFSTFMLILLLLFIVLQLGLVISMYISEDTPDNIQSSHAPIQFVSLIIAIIFLVIIVIFDSSNIVVASVMIILSLIITCTTIYYLRHLDKDYVAMNNIRQSSTTSPSTATTFITDSMKSSFQHEKQTKNEIINTNANRYATLQLNITI